VLVSTRTMIFVIVE